MKPFWRSNILVLLEAFLVCTPYLLGSSFCCSLNDEGLALLRLKERVVSDPLGALSNWIAEVGVENPCSWFGVGCSNGYVALLNLKDLCLRGTIAPDIGKLIHIKSIVLRNNSFSGTIPDDIANLKELEVLDLRHNNLSGQLLCHFSHNLSTVILLLDNNELLDTSSRECRPSKVGEGPVPEREYTSSYNSTVISWKSSDATVSGRKLLRHPRNVNRINYTSLLSPHRNASVTVKRRSPTLAQVPPPTPTLPPISSPPPSPSSLPHTPPMIKPSNSRTKHNYVLPVAIATPLLFLIIGTGIFCYKSGKVSTVKPWATGLSGQLQRAFVTGVPSLKRTELEVACEDFSNVIGSLSVCTLYKGTLSSGVEIAVASISAASKNDWSSSLEAQFRKKIDTLSKVNHKNFINLIGYCEEAEPFTRMLVFEYAPNGTLFEHLHIREAEHLDWQMRLRIAMGMANCLDHLHNLTPPVSHRNLTSSSVYLSEDYAAQVSDFIFCDKGVAGEEQTTPRTNVYAFGVILCEMISGKLPYSSGSDSIEDWAAVYLDGVLPLRETVDQTLKTYGEDQLEEMEGLIRLCVSRDPQSRPGMREVCERLREITGVRPDGAIPRLSPLWWAELEILSTEAI